MNKLTMTATFYFENEITNEHILDLIAQSKPYSIEGLDIIKNTVNQIVKSSDIPPDFEVKLLPIMDQLVAGLSGLDIELNT